MSNRKIVEIDRDKCNGCGLCTIACAEGALMLDEQKKAVLVHELACDGIGACLDVCPVGALKIVEKECSEKTGQCPGAMHRHFMKPPVGEQKERPDTVAPSELRQWPVQLHLLSPHAAYLKGCDLLVAADCTAFSFGSFHSDLLKDKRLVIACPKLDDTGGYIEKLTDMIRHNEFSSITVAIMEVPCCNGLLRMVQQAVAAAGVNIVPKCEIVGIEGELRKIGS